MCIRRIGPISVRELIQSYTFVLLPFTNIYIYAYKSRVGRLKKPMFLIKKNK